jgi:hypothetical protein
MPRPRLTIGGSQLGWVRDGWRGRIHAWQDRIRDPTLTVLLIRYILRNAAPGCAGIVLKTLGIALTPLIR